MAAALRALEKLDRTLVELGFTAYTSGNKAKIDVFAITLALMIGTAGLPHVIVRFFTVPKVSDARRSAGYALLCIALLYTTAPAVGAFARLNFIDTVHGVPYAETADWFKRWESIGLIGWLDKNGDGTIQYAPGPAFQGAPAYTGELGEQDQKQLTNAPTETANEVYVDRDIMVLANPEIAALPGLGDRLGGRRRPGGGPFRLRRGCWLVISTSVSHDLIKERPWRGASATGRSCAPPAWPPRPRVHPGGRLPRHQPAGLRRPGGGVRLRPWRRASLFSGHSAGIFSMRTTKEGAIAGMLAGLAFTFLYIAWFKFVAPEQNHAAHWWFGISPEGIGAVGALLNFAIAILVSRFTAGVPERVQELVAAIRVPAGVQRPQGH